MAYCTQMNLNYLYGTDNITKWSNLSGTTATADTTRIAEAISWADEQVDNALRESRYVIPFTSVCKTICYLSAGLATWWLYKARGQRDTDQWNKMHGDYEDALETLAKINGGAVKLDAAKIASDDPTGIAVVT